MLELPSARRGFILRLRLVLSPVALLHAGQTLQTQRLYDILLGEWPFGFPCGGMAAIEPDGQATEEGEGESG